MVTGPWRSLLPGCRQPAAVIAAGQWRLAQERAPPYLTGYPALRFQDSQRMANRGAGGSEVGGEPPLCGQARPGAEARAPGFGQDELGEPFPAVRRADGGVR